MTAFASEQDGKRTQQQVQELTAQKNRLERLIANILNGEGYSKLTQIVRENVEAVLANNKQLISISFVALIQMLKDDPEMVKLIQNITDANNGKQHKDNHINITQYFESNKDRILNLGEKNYQNIVEALTNNAMEATTYASPNSTLSLPQSSSTFPNLSNKNNIYRIEEAETYHNSEDDISN